MNTKSFETLENTMLSAYLKSKDISEDLKQEWYSTILENKDLFENTDFDGIYHIVQSLAIEGIDDDVVSATAAMLAFDNDIEPAMDGCCSCFMLFAEKYMESKQVIP